MEWNIPRTSEDPLPITLEPGDRLFVVGANGSGKSALIQYLVSSKPDDNRIKRISAHRQTWFNSGSIDFTAQNRKQFEKNRDAMGPAVRFSVDGPCVPKIDRQLSFLT